MNAKREYGQCMHICSKAETGKNSFEELGIIKFNQQPTVCRAEVESDTDTRKTRLITAFPKVFENRVGRMKDYQVKLYVDDSVPPVAKRCRLTPFYIRGERNRALDKIGQHHGSQILSSPQKMIEALE